ncbi:MAG: glycosyltransferase [Candidatus Woesearchaeota archaeon]
MELSIVAVVIDQLSRTQRFVSSIRDNTKENYELIIIDNGSKDKKTIKYLKENSDVYYRFEKITDLSKAWNKGIELSKGKYVLIANNDTVVPPNWFQPMKEVFEKKKNVGMVYPLTNGSVLRYNFKIGRIKSLSKPFKIPRWRQGVWGEFNLFTRKVLKDVGGYCEDYKQASAEDLDMLYTLYSKNYAVYVQPKVFVFHEGSITGDAIFSKSEKNKRWNKNYLQFVKKWEKYEDYIRGKK